MAIPYDPAKWEAALKSRDWTSLRTTPVQRNMVSYAQAQKNLQATVKRVQQEVKDFVREKVNETKPKLTRDQVKSAAKAGHTLVASTPSECFESVSFSGKENLCTCVFARDGYVWEQTMGADEFHDLFGAGDSLGVAWNEAYHGVPSE
jgi:histone H3/H4